MNIIKGKFTRFSWFQDILVSIFKWIKKFWLWLIMISMPSLFECILCSSLLSTEEIKLFAIVSWIFYLSDSLRLFMMSFKYGLILLRCSSTDSILFLSLLVPYSI